MIPVDQTLFGEGIGNCLQAAVASVLEKKLEEVPNFTQDESYMRGVENYLISLDRNYLRIDWTGDGFDGTQFFSLGKEIYCIICGLSPRWIDKEGRRVGHAVVGHTEGYSFVIDHDPHPSRKGIIGNVTSALWIF